MEVVGWCAEAKTAHVPRQSVESQAEAVLASGAREPG